MYVNALNSLLLITLGSVGISIFLVNFEISQHIKPHVYLLLNDVITDVNTDITMRNNAAFISFTCL